MEPLVVAVVLEDTEMDSVGVELRKRGSGGAGGSAHESESQWGWATRRAWRNANWIRMRNPWRAAKKR